MMPSAGQLLRSLMLLALGLTAEGFSCRLCLGQTIRTPAASASAPARRSPPLKPAARPTGDPRLAQFDSSTRMLIEVELRSATPAEREHWLSLLSTVQADQVPYLLSARRQAMAGRNPAPNTSPPAPKAERHSVERQESPGRPESTPSTIAPTIYTRTPEGTGGPGLARVSEQSPPATGTQDPSTVHPAASVPLPESAAETAQGEPTAGPGRRWMAPLRGRWGEGRAEVAPAAGTPEPPAAASQAEPQEPAPESTARTSAYMNVELQRVMTLVRTELEEAEKTGLSPADPQHRRLQVQMRLLHLLAEEPEQAVQAIPGLPPEEQEFWIQLLLSIANELDPPAGQSDSDRLQRTANLLSQAEQHLRQIAPLTLRNACFCHRINNYGSYDRFQSDDFQPGQPVLIYTEVQNFHSELTGTEGYRTRLRTTILIYPVGADGRVAETTLPVDRREFPATEDLCRSIRTDYFHSYRIDLPVHLPQGGYVLRLAMVDELSGQQTASDIRFAIR